MEEEEYYDEEEEFDDTEPDYYVCMCCGYVQSSGISCARCCGPLKEETF